ncbi:PREDICTED: PDZ and LIM domain protein 3-like, partial [Priapulus caudatus]|uniref:PDZ and LIM domain protein 3-like n=1 Tax=Priapulus caudatus TaxID=37621 RepID=A0ABM1E6T9_PRICU
MPIINVRLMRPRPETAWGITIIGGKDQPGCPLQVSKVTPGSTAQSAGVRAGDKITRIDFKMTDILDHDDAQMLFDKPENQLSIALE